MSSLLPLPLICFCIFLQYYTSSGQVWPPHRRGNDDQIHYLPGLDSFPDFNQYSGYLNATTNGSSHWYFYWLVESQNDPEKDSIVLWLNGGPGCSSIQGFFEEQGPFRPHKDGKTLFENIYAWNKVANILFMESPAGAGFSYAEDDNIAANDDLVADHNYRALVDFFDKYPQYKQRDFYITGESYGGIYVPTLVQRVIKNADKFPGQLKGMAVGNGLLSSQAEQNSLIHLQYYRGVIGYEDWEDINEKCCGSANVTCDYFQSLNRSSEVPIFGFVSDGSACGNKTMYITSTLMDTAQNDVYNQYQDCYNPAGGRADKLAHTVRFLYPNFFPPYRSNNRDPWWSWGDPWWTDRDPWWSNWDPWWNRQDQKKSDSITYDSTDPLSGFPCWNDNATREYLNSFITRSAIHVRLDAAPEKWTTCNTEFLTGSYERLYYEMDDVFEYILNNSDIRMLIYNGDVDSVCNFLGEEWFVKRVAENNDLGVIEPRHKWVHRGRVAGYVKRFARIDSLTIKGAGHMAPTDRAGPALQMFANFLANAPYSTVVPSAQPAQDQVGYLQFKQQLFMAQPSAYQGNRQGKGAATPAILIGLGTVAVVAVMVVGVATKRYRKTMRTGYTKL